MSALHKQEVRDEMHDKECPQQSALLSPDTPELVREPLPVTNEALANNMQVCVCVRLVTPDTLLSFVLARS